MGCARGLVTLEAHPRRSSQRPARVLSQLRSRESEDPEALFCSRCGVAAPSRRMQGAHRSACETTRRTALPVPTFDQRGSRSICRRLPDRPGSPRCRVLSSEDLVKVHYGEDSGLSSSGFCPHGACQAVSSSIPPALKSRCASVVILTKSLSNSCARCACTRRRRSAMSWSSRSCRSPREAVDLLYDLRSTRQ